MLPRLLLGAGALALGACAAGAYQDNIQREGANRISGGCGMESPRLWGTGELPSHFRFANERVGGLSGIDYRAREGDYLLVTDDRGAHGGGRIYRATLRFSRPSEQGNAIGIHLSGVTILLQADGSPFAKEGESGTGTDAEAVRAKGDRVYWASEAADVKSGGPQIFEALLRDGKSVPLALPDHLVPDPGRPSGPRDNRSFEGLSIDSDGGIWVGLEAPLAEEGKLPSLESGSWTRIVRLAGMGKAGHDYLYPLEPIARQIPGHLADNGLSELMVLPGPAFLVLERSGSQQADGSFEFVTRIFCAQPGKDAGNDGTLRLHKTLVAELNALGPFENANFEGMTFGPRLPDGRRSLILVADNDFREERPTIIAALAFR